MKLEFEISKNLSFSRLTKLSKKYLRSGCGSAIAALRNPGYLLHIASTSCLVIVGAKLRKKIEVVLCKARGLGLPKTKRWGNFQPRWIRADALN